MVVAMAPAEKEMAAVWRLMEEKVVHESVL